ncbi:DNA uptake protein ComE [Reichenbachiella agariperforans]|uniref:DNA uptake protein ComE n=1 Tax=Reichenbachiella agariperforans TaxID=156994 RepID=A0A1M6NLW6_REIAG|nr:helix-hairpin-helix domain-containing protein [Reichenbachiella agariperforans]SHJ96738.1 DNA uptake protein ComE [Reichenbachiella agariperforans]
MTNRFSNYFRRYFGFSSTEIRGLFVLVPTMLFALFIPQIYKSYLLANTEHGAAQDEEQLRVWADELRNQIVVTQEVEEFPIYAKHFDPNLIRTDQWIKMGFTGSIAERIKKYLTKGGVFKKKEDVLKIYGINRRLVKAYFDYMYFLPPEKRRIRQVYKPTVTYAAPAPAPVETISQPPTVLRVEPETYELNTADTTELKTIRGIGSFWAKSVVTSREELGGFVDRMQVYEINYMPDSVADLIIDHTTFEPSAIRQLNINTLEIDQLRKHPYINYKLANAIVKYRKQHGEYEEIEDLKKIVILKDSVYQKIFPYLIISD